MSELNFSPDAADSIQTSIREDVDFLDETLLNKLYFESQLGAMAVQDDEGTRLLLFRGQAPLASDQPTGHEMLNRSVDEVRVRNTFAGLGIYMGNSLESVSAFATRDSTREINVYLTPPLKTDEVLVLASEQDSLSIRTKAFSREAKQFAKAFLTPHNKRIGSLDEQYGDSQLVVVDMLSGTRVAQRLQLEKHHFPVRPLWYLWRDMDNQFLHVGRAKEKLAFRPVFRPIISLKKKYLHPDQ